MSHPPLLTNGFDTLVCDIDGVVLIGKDPVPGACEALQRLEDGGLSVLFVTNNSTKTPAAIAERITTRTGFPAAKHQVVNSGAAAGRFLAGKVGRVYVLGTDGLRSTLSDSGLVVTAEWTEADSVVVGLDFEVTYRALVEATLAVQNGAAFYATNVDSTYPTAEGQYPGAGALSAVVERATGVAPVVCGKPHRPMRELIADQVGSKPLVVGDRPETDIALGKIEGWTTALVLSGVTGDVAEVPPAYEPDIVIETLAELPDCLDL